MKTQSTAETRLGKSIRPLVDARPALSGIVALRDGHDAFAARALLADTAEHTIDARYYIWQNDLSGTLLFAALLRAADRGVRVRLLLDDVNTVGLDARLAALDAHENVEVRLFNPFKIRRWRWLGLLLDFARLNRRMHNKSFTVDGEATIVGGRNVGDAYFHAGKELSFSDLDVLAIGPVVRDVSRDFERYWTCGSSVPVGRVLAKSTPESLAAVRSAAEKVERDPAALEFLRALESSPFVRKLIEGDLEFEWAATEMVSDDPAKALGRAAARSLLWSRFEQIFGAPARELEVVSAYFVPGKAGAKFFVAAAKRGVKVRVLTNSLEATDVPVVHAGYARRRRELLEAGIELYEMKRAYSPPRIRRRKRGGSSRAALHAKTFAVDGRRMFVGSFNFDPRSARLNTEMGFVIDSPKLAKALADWFDTAVPDDAYRIVRRGRSGLEWIETTEGAERRHRCEPGTRVWKRAAVWFMSKLPIEWLL